MIKFKKLNDLAKTPVRGSDYAAGLDLCSVDNAIIPSGKSATLKTGLSFEIDEGLVGLIWPRSKLGAKKQIQVLAGCVDSDYRGEIMIALLNSGGKPFEVRVGDKIAQLLIQAVRMDGLEEVTELSDTTRGSAGINSTEMRIK